MDVVSESAHESILCHWAYVAKGLPREEIMTAEHTQAEGPYCLPSNVCAMICPSWGGPGLQGAWA